MNILNLPENKDVTEVDLGVLQVRAVTVTAQNEDAIVEAIMATHIDELCRICGKPIEREDLDQSVYAGYSKYNEARSAHGECWSKNIPQEEWAY